MPIPPDPSWSRIRNRPSASSPTSTRSGSAAAGRVLHDGGMAAVILSAKGAWEQALSIMAIDDDRPYEPRRAPSTRRTSPDRQRQIMARRLAALAVGVVVLVLIVLGVKGCLD